MNQVPVYLGLELGEGLPWRVKQNYGLRQAGGEVQEVIQLHCELGRDGF